MLQTKRKRAILACASAFLVVVIAVALIRHEHWVHLRRVQGAWEGTMRFHVGQNMLRRRIVVKVLQETNGSYRAVLDQIDLGLTNIPATRFVAGRSSVVFESSTNFVFQGVLNPGASEITGRWTWPGNGKRSQPLTLTRTLTPDAVQSPLSLAEYTPRSGSDLQGLWQGTLSLDSQALRLHLKIADSADGKLRGELNSVDQPPIIPIPATSVDYRKPQVTVSFQGIGAVFAGTLNDTGTSIAGEWAQAKSWPLSLTRVHPVSEPVLPATQNN
jgi:hypothetical protein